MTIFQRIRRRAIIAYGLFFLGSVLFMEIALRCPRCKARLGLIPMTELIPSKEAVQLNREGILKTLRTVTLALLVAWPTFSIAQKHPGLLTSMTGTWDVQQRMWPGPKSDPVALPAAVAQRSLIRDRYLEEVMQLADDRPGQPGSFSRHALLNYNPVTSQYEYTSLDTRGPQLMVEQSRPIASGASATELKLQGDSFLAPEWGTAKNVRFRYRLTIGAVKESQQTIRLFLTPQTVLPKTEFLAFEYVYTKRP